jgi:hypothetical protein
VAKRNNLTIMALKLQGTPSFFSIAFLVKLCAFVPSWQKETILLPVAGYFHMTFRMAVIIQGYSNTC